VGLGEDVVFKAAPVVQRVLRVHVPLDNELLCGLDDVVLNREQIYFEVPLDRNYLDVAKSKR
jgi:hypothetical protein